MIHQQLEDAARYASIIVGLMVIISTPYMILTSSEKLIVSLIAGCMFLWGFPTAFGDIVEWITEYVRLRRQAKLDKEFGIKRNP